MEAPTTSWVAGAAGRLRVQSAGHDRTPIILVHGNAGDRTHWAQTFPHLARTRRTVAFDLRGMGESDAPADGSFALEDMVADVVRVADALGLGRFVLAGHSYGGSVVAAACGRVPERLAGALFLDASGDLRSIPPEELAAWRERMDPEHFPVTVRSWFSGLLAAATPETRMRVMATLERTPREVYVPAMEGLLGFDPREAISRFAGPKAIVAARMLEGPLSLQKTVPEIPCELIDGVSHWLQLDRPEAVNAALDRFLASVPG
ncbi:MAG TPA: alpha/beta hydrolase [Myxococcaceae bacterium]|nr:alpha/beta hydrolase [Myxococcaceae bacterium]